MQSIDESIDRILDSLAVVCRDLARTHAQLAAATALIAVAALVAGFCVLGIIGEIGFDISWGLIAAGYGWTVQMKRRRARITARAEQLAEALGRFPHDAIRARVTARQQRFARLISQ